MNTAIIVAAGSGQRFGGNIPKQFLDLGGRPLISRTIERFQQCNVIDKIVLVVASEFLDRAEITSMRSEFTKLDCIVAGGESRAMSVLNGLNAVDPATAIVVVHDGARPLVPIADIANVVNAASEYGAACLVADVTDTIKTVTDGIIIGTVDRAKLRAALTPQAFQFAILREAFDDGGDLKHATDESSLVEATRHEVVAVSGDPINIKVTRPVDLEFARIQFLECSMGQTTKLAHE